MQISRKVGRVDGIKEFSNTLLCSIQTEIRVVSKAYQCQAKFLNDAVVSFRKNLNDAMVRNRQYTLLISS